METPVELYAFGNRNGPRRPRPNKDVFPDSAGIIGPESGPPWHGASTFADLGRVPLTGPYHRLPQDTPLPEGLGVVADGVNVDPASPLLATHHTIYPTVRMHVDQFVELFLKLPWQHAGSR
jgi:hypothetical protein